MNLDYDALTKRLGKMVLTQWVMEDELAALRAAPSAVANKDAPVAVAERNGAEAPEGA